ncbi:sulfotransferase domain-containing protein, partial [Alcanivorax sp. HI0007]
VLDVISLIPDAKILVVVRDPVDRLYSTYKYFSNNNYIEGSSISFLEYFELSKDNGLSTGHELFDYGVKHSKYSEYLPAWLALGEKIKVLSFSEINDNPASLMKDISGWLSIDPSFYSTFSFAVKNKTVEVKNKKVHKMVRWISSVLPKGSWRNYFIKIYKFINFEKSEKFLSDSTIDKVKKYYQEEYAFLSRIGINL